MLITSLSVLYLISLRNDFIITAHHIFFLGKWDEVLQFVSSFLHLGQPFPRNKLNGKGCHSYPHSLQRQDIRILDFL